MKLTLLILSFAAALSAAIPAGPAPDAQRLFRVRCGGCHGPEGDGGAGPSLRGKLTHGTPKQLFTVIKNGIPGTAMPATPLPDPQVQKLVAYVQFLNKKK
jgi:nitrite reductase (NO-forming)/hydroxylamine reductase